MSRHRMRRIVGASIVGVGLAMGALTGFASSGAATLPQGRSSSDLTVSFPPGQIPVSVFPYGDATQCSSTNIDYWNLMFRPGF